MSVNSPGILQGKVALVTGSTQGLGAGIARAFAREGAKVVITGRNLAKGRAVADALGPDALFHAADLGKVEDCRALVDFALKTHGGVDILVNSAADTWRSTLESFTPEQFDQQFHLNVRAPLLLAQGTVPSLSARKGVIINIASVNAYIGLPNLLVYASTKGALMTASKNLANALVFARVRVFCLNVGWVDSDGERQIIAREGRDPDFLDRMGKQAPIGRLLRPDDVAEACLFLASEKAAAFSGAVIDLEQFPLGALNYPHGDRDPNPTKS